MKVGVPREVKDQEFRVGLTPEAVAEYASAGHQVLVETGAGAGIGVADDGYREAGAEIAGDAGEVFGRSDMIVKVKEPQPGEWKLLREGQILYAFLHLAPDPAQADGLMASGCTAIAYETVTDPNGGLPLLAPMSEIAGRFCVQAAARSLEKPQGGAGLLMGGVPGVAPARVCIIGGGVVGANAARIAMGMGADVTVLDRSIGRLRQLDDLFQGALRTGYSTGSEVRERAIASDVVIGAVLLPGRTTPRLLDRETVAALREGSVLVDVAIDQGGCFETSRATTHAEPTYLVDGVVHYCVANMPGAVPRTASHALSNATLPLGLRIAAEGLESLRDPHLRAGLNVHAGQITSLAVAESLERPFVDPATFDFAR